MANSKVLAVIPSRLAAQRFPEKPLALIAGKPLVQWVWEAASRAKRVDRVVIATDSEKIAQVARTFGGESVMTSPDCPSGTDRVAAVAKNIDAEIIVNVQGDEPLLAPASIEATVAALQDSPFAQMSTVVRPIESDEEWDSPNVVKAVFAPDGRALYFSRAPIPSVPATAQGNRALRWAHIGLYGFRREALFQFASMTPSILELEERLEQLRALEHGWRIQVVKVNEQTCAVDVPGDVQKVERILATSHSGVKQ